ncbi:hypothetical protein SAY86_025441 [Trapa natans]|uniref:RNA polymerase-associated protein LEO1 n=1 Tax=Trapa natans TaxID=22666 RepID=A0AAN7MS47_TRANT|nr:hypothetical protein SAY86_025441 [Trapa natans]
MGGEEKRHQMMQNLFGDQSEEEEEEVDSEHESNPQPTQYLSDEAEGGFEHDGEGEDEGEGEGEVDIEGHGEAEVESDAEFHEVEPDPGESEGERDQSSQEVDIDGNREDSGRNDSDSDEQAYYGQRVVNSRVRNDLESGSERSGSQHYHDDDDEEVDQARSRSKSQDREKDDNLNAHSAPDIRDVFGDSDEEEGADYVVQNDIEPNSNRSPMEEDGGYGKGLAPEDMIADEDGMYMSEEENADIKQKEKPVGPPLVLEIPLRPPPALPEKMNMVKISNIMGVDPKPFDPKTYVEEDTFVTDESGSKKRIRLENNIVRWRTVRNPNGTTTRESNARFVRWSDGSLQLLIGNEVLDISVQDAQHDQSHLFLRHGKGILQSQGRILRKMRFMPSSLTSNSHRLLTALVDSRHKKVYKVKNCITDIDPEREKEEREKAANQSIRANLLLSRKREKVNRKYTPSVDRRRQLSPGFLEDALDEEDETDYYDSRQSRRRFEDDLEMEARAEKRIMNAKKAQREIPRKSSAAPAKSSRRPVEFSESEREESEYESYAEEEERSPPRRRIEEPEQEYEEEDEEEAEEHDDEEEDAAHAASEEDDEVPKQRSREYSGNKRKGIESDEESPPRKAAPTHRRMTMVYESDDE